MWKIAICTFTIGLDAGAINSRRGAPSIPHKILRRNPPRKNCGRAAPVTSVFRATKHLGRAVANVGELRPEYAAGATWHLTRLERTGGCRYKLGKNMISGQCAAKLVSNPCRDSYRRQRFPVRLSHWFMSHEFTSIASTVRASSVSGVMDA